VLKPIFRERCAGAFEAQDKLKPRPPKEKALTPGAHKKAQENSDTKAPASEGGRYTSRTR